MLKTESKIKKLGCHQNRQWWEYGPQVLTPPDRTVRVFGTHSCWEGNSDMIPCFSQETPGVCDTLEPLTSGNNNSIRASQGITTSKDVQNLWINNPLYVTKHRPIMPLNMEVHELEEIIIYK